MFCSSNNLILKIFSQIIEIITVPCNTDDQVRILFGILLGLPQCICSDNIELDMVAVPFKIAVSAW